MRTIKEILTAGIMQLRTKWNLLLLLYLPILLLFITIGLISRLTTGLTVSYFTRDVTAAGEVPFYAGMVSQLGVILWSATAAICLFTALVLRYQNQNPTAQRFLFQAGTLTAVLLFDDVYLVHDSVFPEYLHISEKYVFVLYFIWCLVFLLLNLPEILSSEFLILGVALVMFGVSVFFDGARLYKYEQLGITRNISTFLEDVPKFFAGATWLFYFTRYAVQSQIRISFPVESLQAGKVSPLLTEGYKPAVSGKHDLRYRTRR
jgi:hypothetical protein